MRARVITVSDRVSAGQAEDASGPLARDLLGKAAFELDDVEVVPDEHAEIAAALRRAVADDIALIVTTGGTGLGPRDVTPEATAEVIQRELRGLAEVMRSDGRSQTPLASLSRGVAGAAGRSLIVNLPGSPKGVEQSLQAIIEVLPHALDVLRGPGRHREDTAAN